MKMAIYKCFKCGKQVKEEYAKRKIRCPYCDSKILYKPRTISSKVKAI
ncbi:MAG: DNA-directed RNA polymerase subunit P [Candidatus Nanoarchaeia archaeon]|nr:DNA-directed RNA polymerase subunit P [Candidatus Nanoarchaeia archaeon]MDD5587949.1 DNA-directed RNA polymerase subunit P [Candidatus Nanoarchaeia archaeon]